MTVSVVVGIQSSDSAFSVKVTRIVLSVSGSSGGVTSPEPVARPGSTVFWLKS